MSKKVIENEKQIDFDLSKDEDFINEEHDDLDVAERPKKFARTRAFVKKHPVLVAVIGTALGIVAAVTIPGMISGGDADVVDGEATEVVPTEESAKSEEN